MSEQKTLRKIFAQDKHFLTNCESLIKLLHTYLSNPNTFNKKTTLIGYLYKIYEYIWSFDKNSMIISSLLDKENTKRTTQTYEQNFNEHYNKNINDDILIKTFHDYIISAKEHTSEEDLFILYYFFIYLANIHSRSYKFKYFSNDEFDNFKNIIQNKGIYIFICRDYYFMMSKKTENQISEDLYSKLQTCLINLEHDIYDEEILLDISNTLSIVPNKSPPVEKFYFSQYIIPRISDLFESLFAPQHDDSYSKLLKLNILAYMKLLFYNTSNSELKYIIYVLNNSFGNIYSMLKKICSVEIGKIDDDILILQNSILRHICKNTSDSISLEDFNDKTDILYIFKDTMKENCVCYQKSTFIEFLNTSLYLPDIDLDTKTKKKMIDMIAEKNRIFYLDSKDSKNSNNRTIYTDIHKISDLNYNQLKCISDIIDKQKNSNQINEHLKIKKLLEEKSKKSIEQTKSSYPKTKYKDPDPFFSVYSFIRDGRGKLDSSQSKPSSEKETYDDKFDEKTILSKQSISDQGFQIDADLQGFHSGDVESGLNLIGANGIPPKLSNELIEEKTYSCNYCGAVNLTLEDLQEHVVGDCWSSLRRKSTPKSVQDEKSFNNEPKVKRKSKKSKSKKRKSIKRIHKSSRSRRRIKF